MRTSTRRVVNLKIVMLGLFFFSSVMAVFAQSGGRSYIREQIQKWGSCRTVAITKTNGDIAIYGQNGWAGIDLPKELEKTIRKLNADGEFVKEVVLTESGRWLILYADNGLYWGGISDNDRMLIKLKEYNSQKEEITSVSFNDRGEWIIVTKNYFAASSGDLVTWLKEGNEKFGQIWTVCISEDGMVAVFETGYKYKGTVPQGLKDALSKTDLDVYALKIAGSSWFFADIDGNYEYNM